MRWQTMFIFFRYRFSRVSLCVVLKGPHLFSGFHNIMPKVCSSFLYLFIACIMCVCVVHIMNKRGTVWCGCGCYPVVEGILI